MRFFKLVSGVMLSDEGRYPYQFDTEWVSRGDAEREINNQTSALIEELEKADKRESDANNNCDALRLSVEVAKKVTVELETQRDEANIKGHRAVLLCMEAEDRERRLATALLRAEKERDIVVGALTQVRCYIDSPRFDEEGEITEMVDDILRKIP